MISRIKKSIPMNKLAPTLGLLLFSVTCSFAQNNNETNMPDDTVATAMIQMNAELHKSFEARLVKEKLISDVSNYTYDLTSEKFVVNGKQQPEKVHKTFIALYESIAKAPMTAGKHVRKP